MQMTLHSKKRSMSLQKMLKGPFMLVFFLLLSFSGFSQNLTLSLKNVSLENAFREIENRSAYRFVYTREMLTAALPVTLEVKEKPLPQVVRLLLEGQPLDYTLADRFIILSPKLSPSAEKLLEVNGTVLSEKGEGIPMATVLVKGGSQATSTDSDGKFHLEGLSEGAVLVVSSIGYQTREVRATTASPLVIVLSVAISRLDETVVIAYGTTTRRLNTGSVARITREQISTQPVSNPIAAMGGRMAGVFVTQQNGLPGSGFNVLIRGMNSIQNGNGPLYIIDGVPFLTDAQRLTQRGLVIANSPFNTINPLDIESIEVLKDADATAIYGTRGANGIVLITTKKNKSGKPKLDLNLYTGWGKVTRTMDFLSTAQYLQMRKEAFANDNLDPANGYAPDLFNWGQARYTDWKKLLIGGTARATNVQAGYSAGNAASQFSLSANYYKETSVFPTEKGTRRGSVALALNHATKDNKLSLGFSASYASDHGDLPRTDLTGFINLPPNAPALYDSAGNLNWKEGGAYFSNPLSVLRREYEVVTDRLTGSFNARYYLLKGLYLKANLGFNQVLVDETSLFPIASQNPAFFPQGTASFGTSALKSWIAEPQLDYTTELGKKGVLNLLVGSTWQTTTNSSKLVDGYGYTQDLLLRSTSGAAVLNASNAYSQYRYQSFFGRVNLNWDATYILNLTARRDGSTRFGPARQYGNFGAVGTSWIFTRYKAVQKGLGMLSLGKLRASYGITGNEPSQNYQYLDTWSGTQYPYGGSPSLRPTRLFNDQYAWEQIRKLELALELGFFNDRLHLSSSWFRNRSDNQLIFYNLPNQTGFTSILRNFPGKVQNTGWEIELGASSGAKATLQWQSSFNLTIARNKLLEFPGLERSSYANSYMIGKPLNLKRGYHFTGLNPATGVYEFEDRNRDGLLNTFDYDYIGTLNPDYYGGLYNQLRYRGWAVDIHFSFVRQKGLQPVLGLGSPPGVALLNFPVDVLSRWKKPGDVAAYQKYSQSESGAAGAAAFKMPNSNGILTDASYVRLKNLSLSWNLPPSVLQKAQIGSWRWYVAAQNLLTLTRYKGFDPENQSFNTLPPIRMITLGTQIIF